MSVGREGSRGLCLCRKCAIIAAMMRRLKIPRLSVYVWVALLAQLAWGSYPPTAKRALMEVPKFSLLFLATLATAITGAAVMWREEQRSPGEVVRFLFGERVLWAVGGVVALRSVTNIFAIDLTRATWVQLIYLLAPFVAAFLGAWFFDEPTPPFTYPALTLSTVGAVLTLVSDWSDVMAGFSRQDFLGLGVALVSMLALAMYFQLVRRSHRREAGRGMIMVQQSAALVPMYALLSVSAGEDWTAWAHLSSAGWATVAWVIFGAFVAGTLFQITALGGMKAAQVTSLMPLRLVSAIVLGWWLLGERLTTLWQWLGALLVVVTVSAYLWVQQRVEEARISGG